MMSEKIEKVLFNTTPVVKVRVINNDDSKELKEQKQLFPFILENDVIVTVQTSERKFSFKIGQNYVWNGADIPRLFWRIIGSKTDNAFLTASLVHDYMLQFKKFIFEEVLKKDMKLYDYRKLTSLIFREIVKQCGTGTIKANIMSWCVDTFQHFCNRGQWKL